MKNSSSRDRSTTNGTSNKQGSAKPTTPLSNININMKIGSTKIESKKVMPPKPPSKSQFNVETNMTESKIMQAKNGLQLLKRKMNRTGMSRQKNYSASTNNKSQENINPFTKTNPKNDLQVEKINIQKRSIPIPNPPKSQSNTNGNKELSKIPQKTLPNKSVQNTHQILSDERPIAHQTNFMDLLQKQMKKQENKSKPSKQQIRKPQNTSMPVDKKIYDENGAEIILQICSKGCGRMFNSQTLPKHQKICQKVFQSKRKAFNSAAHRAPQAQNYIPFVPATKVEVKPQKKKNEIPNWKKQSVALRIGIKSSKNQLLTKQEQKIIEMAKQQLISCQFCGRKFNQNAAVKHIAFCEKKSKQIKGNLGRKR